jgi:Protein of unknown function (DUF4239)
MSSLAFSLIFLLCISGGILLAAAVRRLLPEKHLSGDAKDVVRLGSGLIGTMAALVLGLLIASAKSSYDTQSTQVRHMTANIVLLDLVLSSYGPEALPVRQLMRPGVGALIDGIWQQRSGQPAGPFKASGANEAAYNAIQRLTPTTDVQKSLQGRAAQIATDIAQTRLLLFAQQDNAIPLPFLLILTFWLTILFFSFALFAEPTPMVIGALVVFAVSATGAIYLILELNQPFEGLLQISSEPLRNALAPLPR